jgi:translin
VNIHNGRYKEASKELRQAKALLSELRGLGTATLGRYLVSPETEFVEASAITAIVKGERIPSITNLGVSPEAYVLGMLDCIGEVRRLLLDSVIKGDMKRASSLFSVMEQLYSLLSHFAVYDNAVQGTRRKIDVARGLIEDTRGIMAEESRREELNSSMKRLYKRLGKGD